MLDYTIKRIESQNPTHLGPVFEERISKILEDCALYPGESKEDMWLNKPKGAKGSPIRFEVNRALNGLFEIFDRKRGYCAFIHENRVKYDTFSVGRWYAEFCTCEKGQYYVDAVVKAVEWLDHNETKDHRIGTPVEDAIAYQLLGGAPYGLEPDGNASNPLDRFTVTSHHNYISEFEIYNRLRNLYGYIPRYHTEDPTFDVRKWYQGFIQEKFQGCIDQKKNLVNPI
jgi:hypothetical protein